MNGGKRLEFDSGFREQPVDLTGTPFYHGRVGGVEEAHPGKPDPAAEFTFIPEGEELLVQRRGGDTVRVNLSSWLDQQKAELYADGTRKKVAISKPALEFEHQGARLKYVLNSLQTEVVAGADGLARYDDKRINGDLFASEPLF